MSTNLNQGNIRQASQRALLGVITKETLGICIDWQGKKLVMMVYLEGQTTEAETDQFESAAELTLADVFPDLEYEELIIIENAKPPFATRGIWVFLRRGYAIA